MKTLPKTPQNLLDALRKRYFKLGKGELEVLSWGLLLKQSHREYTCVLDDKYAPSGQRPQFEPHRNHRTPEYAGERDVDFSRGEKWGFVDILIKRGFRIKLPKKARGN